MKRCHMASCFACLWGAICSFSSNTWKKRSSSVSKGQGQRMRVSVNLLAGTEEKGFKERKERGEGERK